MSKLKNTRRGLSQREWPMEVCHELRFLQMSKTSKVKLETVTSSTEDSLVKTSVFQEMEKAWLVSEVDYSTKLSDSQKKFDRLLSSLKMSQPLELEGWSKLSKHLPKSGMTVDGRCYLPQALEPTTSVKGGSYWPTPTVQDACGRTHHNQKNGTIILRLLGQVMYPTPAARDWKDNGKSPAELNRNSTTLATIAGGKLNPMWVEWLIGVPIS